MQKRVKNGEESQAGGGRGSRRLRGKPAAHRSVALHCPIPYKQSLLNLPVRIHFPTFNLMLFTLYLAALFLVSIQD